MNEDVSAKLNLWILEAEGETEINDRIQVAKEINHNWDHDDNCSIIRSDNLKKAPPANLMFPGLKDLSIGIPNISELPEHIEYLKCLNELWISHSKITELPDSMSELKELTRLDMYNLDFRRFPIVLVELSQLERIKMPQCKFIEYLPEEICKLQELEYLDLSETGLKELPTSFGKLENLVSLYVNKTPIRKLPASFVLLRFLKYFYTSETNLNEECISLKNHRSIKSKRFPSKSNGDTYDQIKERKLEEEKRKTEELDRLSRIQKIDIVEACDIYLESLF